MDDSGSTTAPARQEQTGTRGHSEGTADHPRSGGVARERLVDAPRDPVPPGVDEVVAPADRQLTGQDGRAHQQDPPAGEAAARGEGGGEPGHDDGGAGVARGRQQAQDGTGHEPTLGPDAAAGIVDKVDSVGRVGTVDTVGNEGVAGAGGTGGAAPRHGRPSSVVAVCGVLPPHTYPQHEITDAVAEFTGAASGARRRMLDQVHANAGVRTRHLAMPLERYARLADFGEANDVFIEAAVELGCQAVEAALADAGLAPRDVDLLASATVTGLAVPSIDARIAARLRMRSDVRRVPLVGLGCVAGAAGIARVHDHLVGHPDHVAVLVAAEMCSLTVQRDDTTPANMVASGLFGDGAAAVVMVGADRRTGSDGFAHQSAQRSSQPEPQHASQHASRPSSDTHARPQVLDTRSRFYDDTERAMGWDVGATGLRIVLGVEVPELVRSHVRGDVDGFLALHDLTRDDIGWWVAHPGGPKVLEAMQEALEVPRDALGVTWDSLAAIGNLSSASVLHVLADTLRTRPPRPGSLGMLLAMGPGFCLEMVLLRAPEDAR